MSIMEYLHSQKLHKTFEAMHDELHSNYVPDEKSEPTGLLEKNWAGIIRLQQKVSVVHVAVEEASLFMHLTR